MTHTVAFQRGADTDKPIFLNPASVILREIGRGRPKGLWLTI